MAIINTLFAILVSGLQQGAIFALLGIGLTIILGTMKFLNLAHGALYLVGAYLGLLISTEITLSNSLLLGYVSDPSAFGLGLSFTAALILVPLVMFVIGVAMERTVARPFYDRSEVDQLLVTFGLAIVTAEVIKQLIGPNPFQNYNPETLLGVDVSQTISLPLAGQFPAWRLTIIFIAIVAIFLTYLAIERTDFGLVVQAGTRDSEMVRLLGIDINRSYMVVFGIGAALAGFAGLVGGTIINLTPAMGTDNALVPAFLTIVVGGAGSIVGAIFGGFLLGTILAGMQFLASQWSRIVMYGFVAVILILKPEGLFGSVEVEE
jgi:branched-chain amino acid transport system permease protein